MISKTDESKHLVNQQTQDLPHTTWGLEWEELCKLRFTRNGKDEIPPWFQEKIMEIHGYLGGKFMKKNRSSLKACLMFLKSRQEGHFHER